MGTWNNSELFEKYHLNKAEDGKRWAEYKTHKTCDATKCKHYNHNEDDEEEALERVIQNHCLTCEMFLEEI